MSVFMGFKGTHRFTQRLLRTIVDYKTSGEVAIPLDIRLVGGAGEEPYVMAFANHQIDESWALPFWIDRFNDTCASVMKGIDELALGAYRSLLCTRDYQRFRTPLQKHRHGIR